MPSTWRSELPSRGYTALSAFRFYRCPSPCPFRLRAVTAPTISSPGALPAFLAASRLLVLPVSNEQRREDPPQSNQAEVAFKEMDTRKMEDRKSFNVFFKLLEKVKTGVKSYSVTLFKQMEENMACFPNLPSLCSCKLLTVCAVPEYQGSWDATTQSQFKWT